MSEDVQVVLCTVRVAARPFTLAVPVRHVQRVVLSPGSEEDDASWPGLDADAGAPWRLIPAVPSGQGVPVWQVEPPRRVEARNVRPVPAILEGWARRLQVVAFVLDDGRAVPLVDLTRPTSVALSHPERSGTARAGRITKGGGT